MAGDETPEPDDSLLNAAEGLIREEGAEGWTLGDLAERAKATPEAVQAAFGSEWEAFCFVIRRDEKRFEQVTFEGRSADPASRRIVDVLEETVPDFDWSYWIELWPLALRDDRAKALCQELDERFRDRIEEIIRDGVASGEFDVADTRNVAITIATLIDSMATNATLGDTTVRPNYMLDACVTVAGALLGTELPMSSQVDQDA
jgi:AcrR family transcriptional regulator